MTWNLILLSSHPALAFCCGSWWQFGFFLPVNYARCAFSHIRDLHIPCFSFAFHFGSNLWITFHWNKKNKGASIVPADCLYLLCILILYAKYCWLVQYMITSSLSSSSPDLFDAMKFHHHWSTVFLIQIVVSRSIFGCFRVSCLSSVPSPL